MSRKFGISFSAKRALGISGMKSKISRQTGIPLTKSARQRKAGQMMGCAVFMHGIIAMIGILVICFILLII